MLLLFPVDFTACEIFVMCLFFDLTKEFRDLTELSVGVRTIIGFLRCRDAAELFYEN